MKHCRECIVSIVVLLVCGMGFVRAEGLEVAGIGSLPVEEGIVAVEPGIDANAAEITLDDVMGDVLLSEMDDALEINADIELPRERVEYVSNDNLPDSDTLFAGYVEQLFLPGSRVRSNGNSGDRLEGPAKEIYDALLPMIRDVAAGRRSSTVFEIPVNIEVDIFGDSDINMQFDFAELALQADCPYEFYWRKPNGTRIYLDDESESSSPVLTVYMEVCEAYRLDEYTTDVKKLKKPQIAAKKARAVVNKYKKLADYEKLKAYLYWICEATEYNYDAFNHPKHYLDSYNPWELIWVFDGDPETNVVCDGYAKAFKYLCDMSAFKNGVRCCYITQCDTHAWNIVHMEDGKNYHVDATWCDTDRQDQPVNEWMFMQGYDSKVDYRSYYIANNFFQYDGFTINRYSSEDLELSGNDYVAGIAFEQGKSATLYMGGKLYLTTHTEPAKAETKLKWSSSKPSVAVVNGKGVVTPKKAGKTKITVKTANGKKASITVKVVDVQSVKLKEGKSKTLKVGKKLALHATVSPAKVKTKLTWTSSDTKVAAVSDKGVVTAKKAGTAKITVKTANGKSATITITVK